MRNILNRLLTRYNLDARGIDVLCTLCPICNLKAEQLDHLSVRCEVAAITWNEVFRWLEVQFTPFDSITQLFEQVDNLHIQYDTCRGFG